MTSRTRSALLAAAAIAVAAPPALAMPLQVRGSTPDFGAKRTMTYHGKSVGRDAAEFLRMEEQEAVAMRMAGAAFTVRIENRAGGEMIAFADGTMAPLGLSHGNYAVFRDGAPLFAVGAPASAGLERLAEDGNVRPLQAGLESDAGVLESGIFYQPVGYDGDLELWPGSAYEFTVTADPGDKLAFAMMVLNSNDVFVAPDGGAIALFDSYGKPIAGDLTGRMRLYDAGTEVNQDPKGGPDTGPNQAGLDTGPTEGGVVMAYGGAFAYPGLGDVLSVTITPQ